MSRFGPGVSWPFYFLAHFLIALWTVSVSLKLLVELIRHPVLFFKRTKRVTPPNCMLDPSLGTHGYVRANGIRFHYVSCGDTSKPLMLLLHGFPEVRASHDF